MWLEERDDPARMRLERAQGGGAFLWIVAEVVDHCHAVRAGAKDVEPARQPGKSRQRVHCHAHRHPRRRRACNSRERIRQIVPPRHGELERVLAPVVPVHHQRRLLRRSVGNRAGYHADLRLLLFDAEGDRFLRVAQQCQRLGIVGVDYGDAAAFQIVAEQRAQFVHAHMVEADIE